MVCASIGRSAGDRPPRRLAHERLTQLGARNAVRTAREDIMAKCEVCGNDYHRAFQVVAGGITHTFDSFECAIHGMAPVCDHCGCRIVGHGIEANDTFYCCAHCAHVSGVAEVVDNAEHAHSR